jgi:hypothetical protein
MKMMNTTTDCNTCRTHLADVLLDDSFLPAHPEIAAHMSSCAACETEFADLQSTFALLDTWQAPEPSPYFDTRLQARLREAQVSAPEGFLTRVRSYFLFSTGRHMRPLMAGALALMLLAGGGGTAFDLYHQYAAVSAQASPTVNDLKILDNNAQALQQMDQLLDSGDDNSAPPTT